MPSWSAERGGQLVERARGHQPAFVDDHDAVAGLGDLGQDVGREDDRVLALERLDQAPDLDDLGRVEADRRLVEDEDLGIVDEGLGDARPAA